MEMHTTAHSQTTMQVMEEQYAMEMHTTAHSQTTPDITAHSQTTLQEMMVEH